MKIIHCADLHLDSAMSTNFDRLKAKERKAELLQTFNRMVAYADENNIKAIIIAGDMFDTKNVTMTTRHVVEDAIVSHPDITFYYLKGNHDVDSFINGLSDIPENLKLFGKKWTSYEAKEDDNIVITGIELDKDNSSSCYNSLVLDNGKFNIVVMHGQDSETGSKDKAEVINLRALKGKGISYLALGHVHSFKQGNIDAAGTYCYPGCLEGRGFDECGAHGFVVLDIDLEEKQFSNDFVEMASRNLYTINCDVTDCVTTAQMSDRIQAVLEKEAKPAKSLIKLVLTGALDVECEKNIEYLTKHFELDYYFFKISDETRLKLDFSQYKLDESLKGEYVRTVLAEEGIELGNKNTIIRYGLQAIAGEEIV